jgi:hypothetical protein
MPVVILENGGDLSLRDHWLALQRKLTRSVATELRTLLGAQQSEFKKYQADYDRAFSNYKELTTFHALVHEVPKHKLVLVGDYHSCETSQKHFLRLVQGFQEDYPETTFGVALECFRKQDENILRDYLNGYLTEDGLFQMVEWEKTWGFSTAPIAAILRTCRDEKIPIRALRPNQIEKKSLTQQDHLFQERLSEICDDSPETAHWFVLIGELHLAPSHIPTALKKSGLDTLTIYQNMEHLYWRLASRNLEHTTDVMKLADDVYCINSVAPWIKLQSYVQWIRGQLDESDDEELERIDEEDILQTASVLHKFLGLPKPARLDTFSVYGSFDLSFLERLKINKHFSATELKKVELWITERDAYFIPRDNIFYFRFPKSSHIASLSGIFLHSLYTGFSDVFVKLEHDFYRFLLIEALGFLSVKILNPRVKCNQPLDFERMGQTHDSQMLREGRQIPLRRERRLMVDFILQHLHACRAYLDGKPFACPLPRLSMHNERPYYWIATQLGRLLGNALFESLQTDPQGLQFLRQLWQAPLASPDEALSLYLQCIEVCAAELDLTRTKRARL